MSNGTRRDATAGPRSFARAWRGIGAGDDGAEVCAALLAAYSEPQRSYHTLQHLQECLALFAPARQVARAPDEIEIALWFHDAVYDVRRADNEQRSAEWAGRAAAAAGVDAATLARIRSLVMATRHTGAVEGGDAQLLVDVDLAILGAPAPRFAEYEAQIRSEYAWVAEPLFRDKRALVLRSFLDRDRIYATAHFHDRLEAPARANLARAVAALAAGQ